MVWDGGTNICCVWGHDYYDSFQVPVYRDRVALEQIRQVEGYWTLHGAFVQNHTQKGESFEK